MNSAQLAAFLKKRRRYGPREFAVDADDPVWYRCLTESEGGLHVKFVEVLEKQPIQVVRAVGRVFLDGTPPSRAWRLAGATEDEWERFENELKEALS